jgi:hypothetical protein
MSIQQKLDLASLMTLRRGGLATLEVGLESLLPDTQIRLGKVQPRSLYEDFLRNVSKVPDLSLVVNYITGFPWEEESEAMAGLQDARDLLSLYLGSRGRIEHNYFELERLSPMARSPTRFFVDEQRIKAWPWASVLEHAPLR